MSYEFLTRSQAASKLRTSITGGGGKDLNL